MRSMGMCTPRIFSIQRADMRTAFIIIRTGVPSFFLRNYSARNSACRRQGAGSGHWVHDERDRVFDYQASRVGSFQQRGAESERITGSECKEPGNHASNLGGSIDGGSAESASVRSSRKLPPSDNIGLLSREIREAASQPPFRGYTHAGIGVKEILITKHLLLEANLARLSGVGVYSYFWHLRLTLMNKVTLFSISGLLLLAAAASQLSTAQTKAKGGSDAQIERGRYIVESVAMCERCHTPRDPNGNALRSKWLEGGPTQLQPTYTADDWAKIEPRIAGSPPGTDEEFITLLTTGITRFHKPPKPPMPQFHMTREDAQAVLAYLKSIR